MATVPKLEEKVAVEDAIILDFEEGVQMEVTDNEITEDEERRRQAIVDQLPSTTLKRARKRRQSRMEYEKQINNRQFDEGAKTVPRRRYGKSDDKVEKENIKWNGIIDDDFLKRYGEYCPNRPHLNYFGLPCRQWPLEIKEKGPHFDFGAEIGNFAVVENHDHHNDQNNAIMSPFAKKSAARRKQRKHQNLLNQHLDDSDDDVEATNEEENQLSIFSIVYAELKVRFSNFRDTVSDNWHNYEFLGGVIKSVEGKMGTDLANYFRFARNLISVNFLISILWLSFVMIPQVINGVTTHSGFSFSDIFTGNGSVRASVAMSGAYSYGYIIHNTYNIGLAYLIVTGVMFFACMIGFVYQMSQRYKRRVFSEDARVPLPFCELMFRGWDFAIANYDTSLSRKRTLLKGFSELVGEALNKRKQLTGKERARQLLIRGIVHVVVLILLGGALYLIYYVNQKYLHSKNTFESFLPSLTLTLLGTFLPILFSKLGVMEGRPKLYTGRWLITRSYVLRIASPFPVIFKTFDSAKSSSSSCWMSDLGAALYQLLIINMFMSIITTILGDMTRYLVDRFSTPIEELTQPGYKPKILDKIRNMIGYPNFQISKSTLDALFNITIVWMGAIYVPVLPALGFIAACAIFLTKYASMSLFLKPYVEEFSSKSTDLFTLFLLLITLLISGIPVAYSIVSIPPPMSCAPFRINATAGYTSMFGIITETVHSLPPWLAETLQFTATAGFVVPLFFALMLFCYYYYSINRTTVFYINKLHLDLALQRRFKRALILRNKISK